MIDCVKYIKVGDAVKILYHDCIRYVFPTTAEPTTEFIKLNNAINLLRLYPSEDVEPVVRCRDCKHRDPEDKRCDCGHAILWQLPRDDDWFCADGERKDDE